MIDLDKFAKETYRKCQDSHKITSNPLEAAVICVQLIAFAMESVRYDATQECKHKHREKNRVKKKGRT